MELLIVVGEWLLAAILLRLIGVPIKIALLLGAGLVILLHVVMRCL